MSEAARVLGERQPSGVPDGLPAVEVRQLTKIYPDGQVHALNGVDMTVAEKEFVSVTGPSGCGKSTLLHLIAALDRPTSGTIRVFGTDLSRMRNLARYRRQEVGLVFQFHNLLPQLTALENVEIAMVGHGRNRASHKQKAQELLDLVELGHVAKRKPSQLSGGERQRVAIARALANDPRLLLADEPTGSLDSASVKVVVNLLTRLRDQIGMTIVMVTHDESVAAATDRVLHMRDGRMV
jgi:ABC-type lipoprotein export system ATPase subunit